MSAPSIHYVAWRESLQQSFPDVICSFEASFGLSRSENQTRTCCLLHARLSVVCVGRAPIAGFNAECACLQPAARAVKQGQQRKACILRGDIQHTGNANKQAPSLRASALQCTGLGSCATVVCALQLPGANCQRGSKADNRRSKS
eukprot:6205737-Pleurochrysis_carterae.AAC.2